MWPFKSKTAPQDPRTAFLAAQEADPKPWAIFEVDGFEPDGRIKVVFNWNPAFITAIQEMGFHAETEQDSVQLFFYTSQMKPTEISDGDESVQSEQHPSMSANVNRIIG